MTILTRVRKFISSDVNDFDDMVRRDMLKAKSGFMTVEDNKDAINAMMRVALDNWLRYWNSFEALLSATFPDDMEMYPKVIPNKLCKMTKVYFSDHEVNTLVDFYDYYVDYVYLAEKVANSISLVKKK